MTSRRMHLIGVAEHLGVRLPASPPPWASTSRRTEAEKCCKPAATYPSSPPHAYQPLLRRRMSTNSGDELSLRHWTVATKRRYRITWTSIATSTEVSRVSTMRACHTTTGTENDLQNRSIDHQSTYCKRRNSMVFREGGTMGSCLCGTKRKSTVIDELQLRKTTVSVPSYHQQGHRSPDPRTTGESP